MTKTFQSVSAMQFFMLFICVANYCGATESINEQKRAWQIEQLVLQRKIIRAIELYDEFSKSSVKRVQELRKQLGGTPYSDAVKLFQEGQVPNELIPAQSEWMKLVAHERYRWLLRMWLDSRAKENQLVQFELKIEDLIARIKIGDVLTEKDQEEFNRIRLLVKEIDIPNANRVPLADQIESETRANEWLEKAMSGNKKGETK